MIFDRKGISSVATFTIAGVVAAAVFASVAMWYIGAHPKPAPPSGSVACTTDAKLCPDGSYVSRTGPNCEFAACPVVVSSTISTTTWKIFDGQQYGFNFQYPSTWIFDQGGSDGTEQVDGFNITGRPEVGMGDNINMYIVVANGKTLSQFASTWEQGSNSGTEMLTVAGRQAILYKSAIGKNYTGDNLIIDDGKWFIVFDGDGASYQIDYQQILSKFKFFRGAGAFCGGIATGAFPCDPGYSCKLDGTYPDAGGKCVKK